MSFNSTNEWAHTEYLASTYVVLVTFHVVCKTGAAELVGTEEAEVPRYLSCYGCGQALKEALQSLVSHNGFDHRPHCAAEQGDVWLSQHTHYSSNQTCLTCFNANYREIYRNKAGFVLKLQNNPISLTGIFLNLLQSVSVFIWEKI